MSQFATCCPSCGTQWETDDGDSRLIGVVIRDRIDHWRCPDCPAWWHGDSTAVLAAGSTKAERSDG